MSGQLSDPVVLDDDSSQSPGANDTVGDQNKPGTSGSNQKQLVVREQDREPEEDMNQNEDASMAHESDEDSAESGEYHVEAIRSKRRNIKTGADEYLIKWKGFAESDNTWEPIEHLKCPKLLQEFNEKEASKRRRRRITKTSNEPTPQAAKRLRRGPSINGSGDGSPEDEDKLFVEDDEDYDEDEDEDEKLRNRKSKQKDLTRAEPVAPRGFERGLDLDYIHSGCYDENKLYFLVKWVGRDELEMIGFEEMERKVPQTLCRWYRERLFHVDSNGKA